MFVVYRRNTRCAINALSRCAVARMSTDSPEDIRARLTSELKAAMKTKDTVKSTAIRSVLSEVYAADKAKPQPASPSTIIAMIRKATQRRTDAAIEFEKAARPDLAVKEKQEAEIFQAFLPPLLPDSEIDRVLTEIISAQPASEGNPKNALGKVFKAFYAQVDRASVDGDTVRRRAEVLLTKPS